MSAARSKRLVMLAFLAGGVLLGVTLAGRTGRRVTGERLRPYVPSVMEVATVSGAPPDRLRAVAPPINPEYAETAARALSRNRLPLPDDRAVMTFRREDREGETTVALLLYDRPADADVVEQTAGSLLEQALGLEAVPESPSAARVGAQHWRGPGYRALTFRVGNVIGLAGSTDPQAEEWLDELSALITRKLLAQPPPTAPTASGP